MSMSVRDVTAWLGTLEPEDEVAIEDGGLALVSVSYPDLYLEIGGLSEE